MGAPANHESDEQELDLELDLDLPPLGDEEEELGFSEDDALEELDVGASEQVGLDAAEGPDDALDPTEFIDAGDEATSVLGTEEAGDVAGDPLEGDVPEAEAEYGWTVDTEAPSQEDWSEEPSLILEPDETDPSEGDQGELGVDDPILSGGLADGEDDLVPGLPPLDRPLDALPEEDAHDLDLSGEDEIAASVLAMEDDMERGLAALERDPTTRVELLAPGVFEALAVSGERMLAAGEGHLWAGPTYGGGALMRLDARGLEGQDITSVAVDPTDAARVAVGTRLGGVLRSTDSGASFTPHNGWRRREDGSTPEVASYVMAEGGGHGLWLRTRGGALFRGPDFGAAWEGPVLPRPVAAVTPDAAGGVLALSTSQGGGAVLCRSEDGGRRWVERDVPNLKIRPGESAVQMVVSGEVVVITRDDDLSPALASQDGGRTWRALGGLPRAGALDLVADPGTAPFLYAALYYASQDRGVVVGQSLEASSPGALFIDVAQERHVHGIAAQKDAEGDNRVFAVHARARGVVLVASGAGLFRVVPASAEGR